MRLKFYIVSDKRELCIISLQDLKKNGYDIYGNSLRNEDGDSVDLCMINGILSVREEKQVFFANHVHNRTLHKSLDIKKYENLWKNHDKLLKEPSDPCEPCMIGKLRRISYKPTNTKVPAPGHTIVADLLDVTHKTPKGYKYI